MFTWGMTTIEGSLFSQHADRDPVHSDELERAAGLLEAHADFIVLRQLAHRPTIHEPGAETELHGLVVDVETTGRDSSRDEIIQLAAVPFRYMPTAGLITTVDAAVEQFEDPGRPIPKEVQALTGITDADVAGTRLDDAVFDALVGSADLVIAHNAAFDRPFIERRLPSFRDVDWACTWSGVDWFTHADVSSTSLEFLMTKVCHRFFGAHRADADCLAVVELLAATLKDDRPAMRHLLDSSGGESVRIRAVGAAFEVKDDLKGRGYRWFPGADGAAKCWYREVSASEHAREIEWLEANAYPPGRCRAISEPLTARNRFRPMGG